MGREVGRKGGGGGREGEGEGGLPPPSIPASLPILVKYIGYLFNQCDWLDTPIINQTRIGYFNQFIGCFNQSVLECRHIVIASLPRIRLPRLFCEHRTPITCPIRHGGTPRTCDYGGNR